MFHTFQQYVSSKYIFQLVQSSVYQKQTLKQQAKLAGQQSVISCSPAVFGLTTTPEDVVSLSPGLSTENKLTSPEIQKLSSYFSLKKHRFDIFKNFEKRFDLL